MQEINIVVAVIHIRHLAENGKSGPLNIAESTAS